MSYAIISVSDKKNIEQLAKTFNQLNITILTTGGTAKYLSQHHIDYIDIASYTHSPEMMDGRVKTLHPKIHGGILARRGIDDQHLQNNNIHLIDYVVVNLYPFESTIQQKNCSHTDAIETIDIGGPTMLRAAAKNYQRVTALCDPNDYQLVIQQLLQRQSTDTTTRQQLAHKVFSHTAYYDACISSYFKNLLADDKLLPKSLTNHYQRMQSLRYGENPHQQAALYSDGNNNGHSLAQATCHQGKPLSYNNLIDANAAYHCVNGFYSNLPCCSIIKHATPCGIAQASALVNAYQLAYAADPSSAFGGIIAFNQSVDADTAQAIVKQQFVEVIIAPAFSAESLNIFQKKPGIRLLECLYSSEQSIEKHSISGGLLIQETDNQPFCSDKFSVVTQKQPSAQQMQDLLFAWHAVRQVKSNAIVFASHGQTLGIGSGQTSRVLSTELAILKAKHAKLPLQQSVMASDAFFPFADGLQLGIDAGISAVIQPGGSKRDAEVIQAADEAEIAMVFTHQRCFKH